MKEVSKKPENYNLLDPKVIESPYDAYAAYRENAPVYLSPDTGFYIVT